jgi:hypothetical protein
MRRVRRRRWQGYRRKRKLRRVGCVFWMCGEWEERREVYGEKKDDR